MKYGYQKKRFVGELLFALPAILIVLVFMIYPVLMNIGYSFTDWDGIHADTSFVGWDNYKRILGSEELKSILKNTLVIAIMYLPVLNIMALLCACLVKAAGKTDGIYKAILYFPCLLAPAVVGYIWRLLYDPNNGLINRILRNAGLENLCQNWLGNSSTVLPSLSVAVIWCCLGYYMILYYAGLLSVPEELYEAAEIDGANTLQQFFYITIPQIRSSIRMNLVFSTMGVLTMFDIPYSMTGGGPGYDSTTMALQIYNYNFAMHANLGVTLTVLLLILCTIIILIQNKLIRED